MLLWAFQCVQLKWLCCGLGGEEPLVDIALNIHVTQALLIDFPQCAQVSSNHTRFGFVAEVQEAMSLDGLEPPNVFAEGVGWCRWQ